MKKIKKGIFITFEGGEGCGKSTHVRLLAKYLSKYGYRVVTTLEPGATRVGKIIRDMLLNSKDRLSPYSEILLFAVDRIEHIKNVVMPALDAGKIVISDRYMDSTTAYQIGGRKLPKDFVKYVNINASFGIIPNLTIILDVSYEEGQRRVSRREKRDKFERERRTFHNRVRNAYINIAKREPKRVKIISSNGEIKDVQQKIREIADKALKL